MKLQTVNDLVPWASGEMFSELQGGAGAGGAAEPGWGER